MENLKDVLGPEFEQMVVDEVDMKEPEIGEKRDISVSESISFLLWEQKDLEQEIALCKHVA